MLAKTNDETLRQYKHVDPEFVFFYQRWKEMLDSRTLEMHQYNLLNSCAACAELAEVVDKTMEGLFTTRQNAEDCRNEAMEIVKTDQILERRNRPLRNMLLRVLSGKIDTKQRGETADDKSGAFYISLNRLKYQLKTPVRQLKEEYLSYVIHDLEEGLWAGDKAQVEMSADSLISQCITMGWSAKGLSELSSCLEGKESARTKWNRFVRKITVDWQERFEVYYSVKIETRAGLSADHIRQTILSLGLELKKGEEILAGAAGAKDFCSKIKAETVYIVTSVYVPDCIRCGYPVDETLGLNMDAENKKELVRQLISVFRDPGRYKVLENRCRAHSLLLYRCQELQGLLNDALRIRETFDSYIQKNRWHIQRLYRLRNEITHSAFCEEKSLTIYIEQIYMYLAQLISEVVYYIEHKGVETVEEACAVILENYRTYYDFLKEGKMQLADILPDGIVDMREIAV